MPALSQSRESAALQHYTTFLCDTNLLACARWFMQRSLFKSTKHFFVIKIIFYATLNIKTGKLYIVLQLSASGQSRVTQHSVIHFLNPLDTLSEKSTGKRFSVFSLVVFCKYKLFSV